VSICGGADSLEQSRQAKQLGKARRLLERTAVIGGQTKQQQIEGDLFVLDEALRDLQDGDGKRFVVRADEKLTAFVQLGIGGLHLLVFGYIFYFLIVLIIVLCDLVYALPEFCSVVAHEICGLECFGVFM